MRKRLLVAALLLSAAAAPRAGELSEIDRQHLIALLEMTGSWLIDEVSTLSRAQVEFRRAPGSWSILARRAAVVATGASQ
jgi:hypothetical protein